MSAHMSVHRSVSKSGHPALRAGAAACALSLMLLCVPAVAQTTPQPPTQPPAQTGTQVSPPSGQSLENKTSCDSATKAQPATAPDRQSADGTAPGNIGSTGWTGGTGGAHMGTNTQGALPESRTWQPPTARGLDLAMAAPKDPPAGPAGQASQGC